MPWDNYFKLQHINKTPPILVALPADQLIPFTPKDLFTYLSYFSHASGYIRWTLAQFGNGAGEDVEKFFQGLIPYYQKSAEIFRQVPTTCGRPNSGGPFMAITRLADKDLNAAPSLHVIIVLHVYLALAETIQKRGQAGKDFTAVKNAFFNQAVRIIESTLLTKQHCLLDIALAMVMVSMEDKDLTPEMASRVIDSMFQNNLYNLPQTAIAVVRAEIQKIYSEQLAAARAAGPDAYPSTIISYLKNLH